MSQRSGVVAPHLPFSKPFYSRYAQLYCGSLTATARNAIHYSTVTPMSPMKYQLNEHLWLHTLAQNNDNRSIGLTVDALDEI